MYVGILEPSTNCCLQWEDCSGPLHILSRARVALLPGAFDSKDLNLSPHCRVGDLAEQTITVIKRR